MSVKEQLVDILVCVIGLAFLGIGAYQIKPAYAFVAVGAMLVGLVIVSRIGAVKR